MCTHGHKHTQATSLHTHGNCSDSHVVLTACAGVRAAQGRVPAGAAGSARPRPQTPLGAPASRCSPRPERSGQSSQSRRTCGYSTAMRGERTASAASVKDQKDPVAVTSPRARPGRPRRCRLRALRRRSVHGSPTSLTLFWNGERHRGPVCKARGASICPCGSAVTGGRRRRGQKSEGATEALAAVPEGQRGLLRRLRLLLQRHPGRSQRPSALVCLHGETLRGRALATHPGTTSA